MLVKPDFDTVQKGLRWLAPRPNQVFEIRTIKNYTNQCAVGYFNDTIIAANSITNSDNGGIAGTYVTLNPVVPELFARVSNRMVDAKAGAFTNDKEIIERRGLLLDFDPKRVSGISSSDEEHEATLQYMLEVTADLQTFHGFPSPCLIDSGNGGHGRYITESLPNDDDTKELFKVFLQCMAARYDTSTINIDKSVFNASRITRVPGTPARKGENNVDRPHRVSKIIQHVDPFDILHRGVIERFVNLYRHLIVERPKRALGAPTGDYPDDEKLYRTLNRTSKDRYHDWVPHLLGTVARKSGTGYRISSDNIGRDLEEDILIDEMGIKDFGVHDMGDGREGRRTAVSLLSELVFEGNKRKAAEALATCLDTDINEFEGKLIRPPLPVDFKGDPITMPSALMGHGGYGMPMNGNTDADPFGETPTRWMIQDLVAERMFNILSGPMRVGKSTLTRQVVAACLAGGKVLGSTAPKCEVMYVDYENMKNDILPDIRHQLRLVLAEQGTKPEDMEFKVSELMKGFHYYCKEFNDEGEPMHQLPMGRAGIDHIVKIVRENYPKVKLICVDPLRFMKDETIRSRDIVTQQFFEGMDFVSLCIKANAAIWAIHHDNKASGTKAAVGNDPLLAAGGTAGLMATAQNSMSIQGDRIPDGIDAALGLYIAPRIGQAMSRRIKFVNGRFEYTDSDAEIYYHRNDIRGNGRENAQQVDAKILSYLEKVTASISADIATLLNIPKVNVDRRLDSLKLRGIVDFTLDTERLHARTTGPPPKVWFIVGQASMPPLK